MKKEIYNIVLHSPGPLDDGLRKLNWMYLVGIIVGLVAFPVGSAFGVFIAWLIKYCIADWKMKGSLRKMSFALPIEVNQDQLYKVLVPPLTQMEMKVEMNKDGWPRVSYKRTIYDVNLNADETFGVWWRYGAGRVIFGITGIKAYKNAVAAIGIIAYTLQSEVQKIANSSSENITEQQKSVDCQDDITKVLVANNKENEFVRKPSNRLINFVTEYKGGYSVEEENIVRKFLDLKSGLTTEIKNMYFEIPSNPNSKKIFDSLCNHIANDQEIRNMLREDVILCAYTDALLGKSNVGSIVTLKGIYHDNGLMISFIPREDVSGANRDKFDLNLVVNGKQKFMCVGKYIGENGIDFLCTLYNEVY